MGKRLDSRLSGTLTFSCVSSHRHWMSNSISSVDTQWLVSQSGVPIVRSVSHNDDCFLPSSIRTPGPVERKLLWLRWKKLKKDGDARLQRRGITVRADSGRSHPAIICLWDRFSEMRFLCTWLVWPSRLTASISLQMAHHRYLDSSAKPSGWTRSLSCYSACWEWRFSRARATLLPECRSLPYRSLQFVTGIWLRTCAFPRRWISDSRPKAWV